MARKSNNRMLHELAGIKPSKLLSNNELLEIIYKNRNTQPPVEQKKLISPNGTPWELSVDDNGALITTEEDNA